MLGEIASGLSIYEWLLKFWKKKFLKTPESIATRFFSLFETHGVHRNQIPRFMGHGLTIADVCSEATLLPKLSEEILDAASEKFAVRREWLDGADIQIYERHDFYVNYSGFEQFLDSLLKRARSNEIIGVVVKSSDKIQYPDAVILLQETVGYIGDKAIYRYYVIESENFNYWRSRVSLTACVAMAWKKGIYLHGTELPHDTIQNIASGELLLGWNGDGIWSLGRSKWYPEDLATNPNMLLGGVNPEDNNFGLISALKLWLELDEKGFMDTGYSENAREYFLEALAKLQAS